MSGPNILLCCCVHDEFGGHWVFLHFQHHTLSPKRSSWSWSVVSVQASINCKHKNDIHELLNCSFFFSSCGQRQCGCRRCGIVSSAEQWVLTVTQDDRLTALTIIFMLPSSCLSLADLPACNTSLNFLLLWFDAPHLHPVMYWLCDSAEPEPSTPPHYSRLCQPDRPKDPWILLLCSASLM